MHLINRDVENSVLQKDEEVKALYDELNANTQTSYTKSCNDCTGEEGTSELIRSFKEFLVKDQSAREGEERELLNILKKQKNNFDLMTWNRHVQGIASKREARYQTNY